MRNKLLLLIFFAAVFLSGCGTMGIPIFDPINSPRQGYVPQVDWTRAPLSVIKNTARIDLELQEAQQNYDAARNSLRDDARAEARRDFRDQQGRGAHAPSIIFGKEREAYGQEFDNLDGKHQSLKEQGAANLGKLEFYRSRQR